MSWQTKEKEKKNLQDSNLLIQSPCYNTLE